MEDPATQMLDIRIRDSHLTGRPDVGYVRLPLSRIPSTGIINAWLPVQVPRPHCIFQPSMPLFLQNPTTVLVSKDGMF